MVSWKWLSPCTVTKPLIQEVVERRHVLTFICVSNAAKFNPTCSNIHTSNKLYAKLYIKIWYQWRIMSSESIHCRSLTGMYVMEEVHCSALN